MNLMQRFSIRSQVVIYAGVGLGLFAIVTLAYFYVKYNSQAETIMADKSRSITQMLGMNVAAGVIFEDTESVKKVLESVKQDQTIEAVYVYNSKNEVLASYNREGNLEQEVSSGFSFKRIDNPGVVIDSDNDHIYAREKVSSGTDAAGTIILVAHMESVRKSIMSTVTWAAMVYALIFLVTVLVMIVLTGSLVGRIQAAADIARRISEGDLAVPELDVSGKDEVASLNRAVNVMAASLKRMLGQLHESSEPIKRSSSEIQTSTVQQRHGLENQATAISEITTTINELKTTAKQSAAIAQRVLEDSERSVEVSKEGLGANDKAMGGMKLISDQMETIAQTILSLSERSQQIVEIVSTVGDLAQQSNFLALNASIEAAKAGEHGKGFAVVAMEVRNLAEQSQQATAQIRSILSEIQSTMNSAVLVTENGSAKVSEGVDLIERMGKVIVQLAEVVTQAASSSRQISASATQQSLGIEQIAQAMGSISQTMNETTASAKQLEKTAEWLAEVGKKMTDAIEGYTN